MVYAKPDRRVGPLGPITFLLECNIKIIRQTLQFAPSQSTYYEMQ